MLRKLACPSRIVYLPRLTIARIIFLRRCVSNRAWPHLERQVDAGFVMAFVIYYLLYQCRGRRRQINTRLLISRIHHSPSNIRVMVSFRWQFREEFASRFSMTGSTRARVCVECREVLENKDFNHLSALTVSGKLRSQLFLSSKTP